MRSTRQSDLTELRSSFPEPAQLRAELLRQLEADPSLLELADLQQVFDTDAELRRGLRTVRVDILPDMTVAGLLTPLRVLALLRGLDLEFNVRPAYQLEQELLGTLRNQASDALLALMDIEKMLPGGVTTPSDVESQAFFSALERRLDLLAEHARQTGAKILVSDFVLSHGPLSPAFDHVASFGRRRFVQTANHSLYDACQKRGLEVLSIASAISSWGEERCLALKQYLATDALFSPSGNNCVAQRIARQLAAYFTPRKKVLAVDLDNTLWGGVLGEDGPDGIQFRPDSYRGRVFHAAVSFMKALSDSGVLLVIASKNNEAEVLSLLARGEFLLQLSDLAAYRINWLPKPDNLTSLAAELGLGLDSFVFLDDSPVECALVRRTLPEVTVVQVPPTLSEYPQCLRDIECFDRAQLTEADRGRKADYQSAHKRRHLESSVANLDEFIRELQIQLEITPAQPSSLDRVAQLFERTNQFNLSQLRYRREELQAMLVDPLRLLCVDYSDRFGRSGLVGALAMSYAGGVATIENFVLSCRVLGRKVEHAVLAAAATKLLARESECLRFKFHASGRNQPARDFLNDVGGLDTLLLALPLVGLSTPQIEVVWREPRSDHERESVEQTAHR